jgi:hypothetical protein
MLKHLSVASSTAAAIVLLGAPALADPPQESVPFQCGDTTLLVAVAPANGTFTPNFDTDATTVFKPAALTVTKTVVDAQGQQLSSQTDTQVLGQGKQAQRTGAVTCTASQTIPGEYVGLPADQSLAATIVAIGFFTPRHG